ncbi:MULTISPECIES: cell division protein ZapE [unclassified Rhodococcus (in: high G+C Gram-positive bacteria)]|uniref:cell division protein ZapE n=1 Tax=unclassified Rhodococcus (in: high G+C Gram-positive bacteria) TaxID=192944 RepID=UPI00163ABEAE|nr:MULTISPECIES: cell division protein ZapE [unclassified Rhodococcus (in: high G+C Gram-positive bacteria)]MBC2641787.1 cell division protein ZapE [Rhodococcus sp. 3A]MBC2893468.1 cell division protein ZapE [Rhodococcus sp. 4CII]
MDDAQRAAAAVLRETADGLGGDMSAVRGVYLWGPVGRGKTWLMDGFFRSAPGPKRRVHFHDFFRGLHADAHHLGSIDLAVDAALGDVRLLCFDEFHLHDVGDAMLVARLLKALFARGITLVVTSNYPPGGLLPNPLFHHLFAPTIAVLEQHLTVVRVAGPVDYRTVTSAEGGFGLGRFVRAAETTECPDLRERVVLPVGTRTVTAAAVRDRTVWFDFPALCGTPTAPADYLDLSARFPCWVITGVPRLREVGAETVRRFANVVDVLYDQETSLTVVADVPWEDLCAGLGDTLDVDRLVSRLSTLRR